MATQLALKSPREAKVAIKDYIMDPYVRSARLQPALLVALPVALGILAWFPEASVIAGPLWGLVAWCGGTALVAQIARDAGKAKEPSLFARWDGTPATRLLRHRSSANRVLLRRRHHKLRGLLADVHIPTAEEEVADPARADETYEACVQFLRDSTRPRQDFPLVFQANCEYGFRRNFWGMKPLGVALAVGSAAAIAARLYLDVRSNVVLEPTRVVSMCVVGVLAAGWLLWFTPSWVRLTADAYAERLLGALEKL